MLNKDQKSQRFKHFKQTAYVRRDQKNIVDTVNSQESLQFLETRDQQGNSPIHLSVYLNQYHVLQSYIQFIKTFSLSKQFVNQKWPQQISNEKQMHRLKYYINLPNNEGLRPIHYASYNGNIPIMKLLSDNGAKLHISTANGLNIVHFASQGNQPVVFHHYLHKIDLTISDIQGNSALHWACHSGSESVVSILLANYVQLDAPNNQGNTPLHIAVQKKRHKIIKKLLLAGANRNLLNKQNKSPISISQEVDSFLIPSIMQQKQKCGRLYKYRKRDKKNKILLTMLPIFLEIALLVNIVLIFTVKNKYIPNFFTISAVISIISFVSLGIFIELMQILPYDYSRQALDLDKKIDYYNLCFYCNVEKNKQISHCYICGRCTTIKYKHCWLIDNCIQKDNIILYIILNLLTCVLAAVAISAGTYTYICYREKIKIISWQFIVLVIDEFFIILFIACLIELVFSIKFYLQSRKDQQLPILSDSYIQNQGDLIEEIHKRKKMRWKNHKINSNNSNSKNDSSLVERLNES